MKYKLVGNNKEWLNCKCVIMTSRDKAVLLNMLNMLAQFNIYTDLKIERA